ncbi:MAG TPA: PQQ-binding-like beta-propeller repeat protein, partial [Pyrinomonadaceae bacterium]|nr:PQQ-binding-like beta-propeller repeat protein [Pyrinomonadaceae bacterium]
TGLLFVGSAVLWAAACAAGAGDRRAARASGGAGAPPSAAAPSDAAAQTQASPAATVEAAAASPVGAGMAATAEALPVKDWPQWRGPSRDGHVGGAGLPAEWPKGLKEEWRVKVGVGHSSPVVAGGRVYQFARQGEEEVVVALDPATGKEIWRSAGAAAPYEMNPAARDHGKGPKSTPVVAGGRVFTLGINGVLSAHDAATGRLVWRKEFSKRFPSTSPLYGTAMSPLVEKNLLIAHVGGHDGGALTAFDAATGKEVWSYAGDGPAYSSPVVFTAGGERQVVTFTQKELVAVSAASGKLLWKLPAKTHYDTNCNTPVAYKDTLIVSIEGRGLVALRPVKQGAGWAAQEVWANSDVELYMNTPVLDGDRLVGFSARKKGQFFAVDAATGKTLWQGPGRAGENASILNVGGALLLLTNDSTMFVLSAGAKGFEPAAQYDVAQSPTWAHPLFLGHRILVKDETTLASLSLR